MKYSINFIICVFLLASCGGKSVETPKPTVQIKTIEIQRPAPIIPEPQQLELNDVTWDIITKTTVDQKLSESPVYYGLDEKEYKDLSLNISALRAYIQQQLVVIKKYKDTYSNELKK